MLMQEEVAVTKLQFVAISREKSDVADLIATVQLLTCVCGCLSNVIENALVRKSSHEQFGLNYACTRVKL